MIPNSMFELGVSRRQFLGASSAVVAGIFLPQRRLQAAGPETIRKQLRAISEKPFNGEPDIAALVKSPITPLEHFFVRSHGPVPTLDASSFEVSVEGLVNRPMKLGLAEIQSRFKPHQAEATLTCAGNRRVEMNAIKPIAGVAWHTGAIGNATWTGVSLADVLKAAEIQSGAKHVWFEGADPITEKNGRVAPFGASIPIEKALAVTAGVPEALLAYLMNGKPLSAEHGYPLRTVVPGYIGARSVKWIRRVIVSDRPSTNHYVADAYKLVQTDSVEERAKQDPIYEYAVNGVIGVPAPGTAVKGSTITVAGYALPTGRAGCVVKQVSVSNDGGRSWSDAKLIGPSKPYCWQLWSAEIPVTAATEKLTVRVTDSLGQSQPEQGPWNFKGYLFNGWHHVPVKS